MSDVRQEHRDAAIAAAAWFRESITARSTSLDAVIAKHCPRGISRETAEKIVRHFRGGATGSPGNSLAVADVIQIAGERAEPMRVELDDAWLATFDRLLLEWAGSGGDESRRRARQGLLVHVRTLTHNGREPLDAEKLADDAIEWMDISTVTPDDWEAIRQNIIIAAQKYARPVVDAEFAERVFQRLRDDKWHFGENGQKALVAAIAACADVAPAVIHTGHTDECKAYAARSGEASFCIASCADHRRAQDPPPEPPKPPVVTVTPRRRTGEWTCVCGQTYATADDGVPTRQCPTCSVTVTLAWPEVKP